MPADQGVQRGFVRVEREPPAAGDDPGVAAGFDDDEGAPGRPRDGTEAVPRPRRRGRVPSAGCPRPARPRRTAAAPGRRRGLRMKLREPLRGWGPVPARRSREPASGRCPTAPPCPARRCTSGKVRTFPCRRASAYRNRSPCARGCTSRITAPNRKGRGVPMPPCRGRSPRTKPSSKWCPPSSYASRCPGSSARHSTDAITCRDTPCSPRSSRPATKAAAPPRAGLANEEDRDPQPRTGTPRSQAPRA